MLRAFQMSGTNSNSLFCIANPERLTSDLHRNILSFMDEFALLRTSPFRNSNFRLVFITGNTNAEVVRKFSAYKREYGAIEERDLIDYVSQVFLKKVIKKLTFLFTMVGT